MSELAQEPLAVEIATVREIVASCPWCGFSKEFGDLEIEETISGSYRIDAQHRFFHCEDCGGFSDAGSFEFYEKRAPEPPHDQ